MKLRLPEAQIDMKNGDFDKHCKLGRKETGEKLSKLLDAVIDPLVVAVDGSWGSGKTHFLKCWVGAHKNELKYEAKIIYFDAFEHDYLDDPLIALTLALEKELGLEPNNKYFKILKKVIIAGGKLGTRIGLAAATAGVSEITGAVGDAAIFSAKKEGEKLIEKLWKKEKSRISAMKEFEEALKSLTNTGEENETKLIIVIDELDRCRPDYALLLLEIIKHFFAIENIKFVLGVNLQELANSVEARYGKNVDANSYLQKFIDIRLKLGTSLHLNNKESVSRKYFQEVAKKQELNSDKYKNSIDGYLENWGNDCPLTLREIERLVTAAVLTPSSPHRGQLGKWILIGGLLIIKIQNPELFQKIRIGTASFEEICEYFNLPMKIDENTPRYKKELASHWYYLINNELLEPAENNLFADYGFLSEEDTLHSSIFKHYLDVFESEALV